MHDDMSIHMLPLSPSCNLIQQISKLKGYTMLTGWPRVSYQDLLVIPMYGIVSVTYIITLCATIMRILFWDKKWSCTERLKAADQKLITYMLEGFFNMLHHREKIQHLHRCQGNETRTLQDCSSERAENVTPLNESSEAKVATVGVVLRTSTILSSKWAMTILSWYVANIASLAVFIFWDEFSVKEVIGCSDGRDCYYPNNSLIIDCYPDDLVSGDREIYDKATCYELTLDFPKAIAEVTGILFLGTNGFAFLMFLLLLIIDGIASPCMRIIAYSVIACVEYASVGSIIFAFVLRLVVLYKEETINIIIEELLISTALLTGVTTPWIVLLWAVSKYKGNKNKLNGSSADIRKPKL